MFVTVLVVLFTIRFPIIVKFNNKLLASILDYIVFSDVRMSLSKHMTLNNKKTTMIKSEKQVNP